MIPSRVAADFEVIRHRMDELRKEKASGPAAASADHPPLSRSSPPITLHDACKLVGSDNAGTRCANCSLAACCFDDSRWLVRRHYRLV